MLAKVLLGDQGWYGALSGGWAALWRTTAAPGPSTPMELKAIHHRTPVILAYFSYPAFPPASFAPARGRANVGMTCLVPGLRGTWKGGEEAAIRSTSQVCI